MGGGGWQCPPSYAQTSIAWFEKEWGARSLLETTLECTPNWQSWGVPPLKAGQALAGAELSKFGLLRACALAPGSLFGLPVAAHGAGRGRRARGPGVQALGALGAHADRAGGGGDSGGRSLSAPVAGALQVSEAGPGPQVTAQGVRGFEAKGHPELPWGTWLSVRESLWDLSVRDT